VARMSHTCAICERRLPGRLIAWMHMAVERAVIRQAQRAADAEHHWRAVRYPAPPTVNNQPPTVAKLPAAGWMEDA